MSEYTPTTDEVQDYYVHGQFADPEMSEQEHVEAFNRWLAAHDAEVGRAAAARALEEAASDWAADPDAWGDNEKDYRNELRARAAELREGRGQ